MTFVTLPQIGSRLASADAETILQTALDAGVAYPHSCRSGRCGACKSRLLQGHVDLGKHSPFALSDDERAEGLILACRSVPTSDVTVEWLDEAFSAAPPIAQSAEIAAIERMTHDILAVRLLLADRSAFRFAAGQYLTLTLPGLPPRQYSMANHPNENLIELHVRAIPDGRTSNWIHSTLKLRDVVAIEGPMGSAYLREAHRGPIVALAGGSGLAPIKSIVETALIGGVDAPIHLYFSARAERDLYLVSHFRTLEKRFANFTFTPVLSQEESAFRRMGHISDALAEDHRSLSGAMAYVCGAPAMVDAAAAALTKLGVPASDIHADIFFTPDANKPA